MTPIQQVLSGLITFLLGLIAKFAYDFWAEQRHKLIIQFTKSTINTFSLDVLEEKHIRENTAIRYAQSDVRSLSVFAVTIENKGRKAVRGQAFTVLFDEGARILGVPQSDSSTEDLRGVNSAPIAGVDNAYRFTIDLLKKDHSITWKFVVADHFSTDFEVEEGIDRDNPEADLDAQVSKSTSKRQTDLLSKARITLQLVITLLILLVIQSVTSQLQGITGVAIVGGFIIVILTILLFITSSMIPDLIRLLQEKEPEKQEHTNISIGDIGSAEGINIAGKDAYISTIQGGRTFEDAFHTVDAELADEDEKSDARYAISKLEESSRSYAKQEQVSRWLEVIKDTVPEVLLTLEDIVNGPDAPVSSRFRKLVMDWLNEHYP